MNIPLIFTPTLHAGPSLKMSFPEILFTLGPPAEHVEEVVIVLRLATTTYSAGRPCEPLHLLRDPLRNNYQLHVDYKNFKTKHLQGLNMHLPAHGLPLASSYILLPSSGIPLTSRIILLLSHGILSPLLHMSFTQSMNKNEQLNCSTIE